MQHKPEKKYVLYVEKMLQANVCVKINLRNLRLVIQRVKILSAKVDYW